MIWFVFYSVAGIATQLWLYSRHCHEDIPPRAMAVLLFIVFVFWPPFLVSASLNSLRAWRSR